MLIKVIRFWDANKNRQQGVSPLRIYLVIASPKRRSNGGKATIIPLSEGGRLESRYVENDKGGESSAMEEALQRLKGLPENQELESAVNDIAPQQ